ncbi:MAG: hypothetical protein KC561_05840 [Myxococcales bacterium]|nr:hypothetical protein [Myxococcales bacterium]
MKLTRMVLFVACLLLLTPLVAQGQPAPSTDSSSAAALAWVPSDWHATLVIPSLSQAVAGLAAVEAALEVPAEDSSAAGLLPIIDTFLPGVDHDGPLIVGMPSLSGLMSVAMTGSTPTAVVIFRHTDFAALLSQLGATPGDPVSSGMVLGMPIFLRNFDGVVVLSTDEAAVTAFDGQPVDSVASTLTPTVLAAVADSQIAVQLSAEGMGELFSVWSSTMAMLTPFADTNMGGLMQVMEAYGELFTSGVGTIVWGGRVDGSEVVISGGCSLVDGSVLAQVVTSATPNAPDWSLLPPGNALGGVAMDYSGVNFAPVLTFLEERVGTVEPGSFSSILLEAYRPFADGMGPMASAWYATDDSFYQLSAMQGVDGPAMIATAAANMESTAAFSRELGLETTVVTETEDVDGTPVTMVRLNYPSLEEEVTDATGWASTSSLGAVRMAMRGDVMLQQSMGTAETMAAALRAGTGFEQPSLVSRRATLARTPWFEGFLDGSAVLEAIQSLAGTEGGAASVNDSFIFGYRDGLDLTGDLIVDLQFLSGLASAWQSAMDF